MSDEDESESLIPASEQESFELGNIYEKKKHINKKKGELKSNAGFPISVVNPSAEEQN